MSPLGDVGLTQVASHLLARYAWAIDDRAYGDLLDVFTADLVADYGSFACRSAEELVDRMREIHAGLRTTQHLVGSVLALSGSDGSVMVRSHVRAVLVRAGGEGGRVEVAASYLDTMVLTSAGHRISRRRVEGRWIAGERSILPWFNERLPGETRDGASVGASSTRCDETRVDRSQTTSAVSRSTSPDDRGI